MPNTVIALKKSATPAAAPTSLANGELAINYADGILYYKAANGVIASIQSLEGNSFGTVNANGTLLVSDTVGDILTVVSGNNISIVGDAINDRLTIRLADDVVIPSTGTFKVSAVGNDEGGEIKLGNAITNSVLTGDIIIDIFQNRLRFFESGGTNRGAFINLASASTGVGTDLLAGASATDTTARNAAGAAFDKANIANITADLAFNKANAALPNVSGVSFNGNLTVSQNLSADRIFSTNNGLGENFKVGDDAWIGDFNIANSIRIKGQQNSQIGYVVFGDQDGKALGRAGTGALTYDSNTVWHAGNDGAGSGLDADLLDGQHGSYYGIATDVTAAFAHANQSFNRANTANITADRAFNHANAAFITANIAFANANTVMISAQAAFTVANAAFLHANSGYAFVNSISLTANAAFLHANAAFANGNTVIQTAQSAFNQANISFLHANAAFASANAGQASGNAAQATANASYAFGNSAHSIANLAFAHANAAFAVANTSGIEAEYAFLRANLAHAHANAAFASSNSVNTYSNATYVKLTATSQTITGNVNIVGDLTLSGNTFTIDATRLEVDDPLLYLAANNYTSDIVDIGFIANYVNATGQNVHTGLYREHEDKMYYLFQGYDKEPINNHIGALSNNMTLAVLNADLRTSNLVLGGANAILTIGASFNHANAAHASANAGMAIGNAAFASANAGQATANAAFARANTANITADRAFNHANAAFATANVAFANANNVMISAQAAFTVANASFLHANASYAFGNSAHSIANLAFTHANAAFAVANTSGVEAEFAFLRANLAHAHANAAFAVANSALSNTSGVAFNGNLNLPTGNLAVGIATPNTGARLQVYNTTGNSELWITADNGFDPFIRMTGENGATSEGFFIQYDNSVGDTYFKNIFNGVGAFHFQTAAVEAFTIQTDGKVGVGTTSPGYILDVKGTGNVSSSLLVNNMNVKPTIEAAFASANAGQASANAGQASANAAFATSNANYAFSNSAHSIANLAFTHANGAFAKANAALANTAGISTAGALIVPGVLTANAGGGSFQMRAGGTTDHVYIEYYPRSATGSRGAYVGYGSAGTNTFSFINETTTGSLELGTAGGADLAIDSAGNVGIGRTNPGFKLDVVGTANASNLLVNGNMVFTAANDGAGSNLDADLLDGQQGTYYGIATDVTAANRVANAAFLHANAVYAYANANYAFSNSAHSIANLAFTHANNAYIAANTARTVVNDTVNATRYLMFANGTSGTSSLNVAVGLAFTPSSNTLNINGALNAVTKSFVIPHPVNEGMFLRYGSLEGPENGVYVRGKIEGKSIIELPDYWWNLIDQDTITVNLTPYGRSQDIWVQSTCAHFIHLNQQADCFFTVFAERKDVDKLVVEY